MILDYPLLVFVMSFIVLVLSAKTGDGLRMKVRRLREDGGSDFGVVLTGALTLTLPIGLALATVCYSQGKPQGRPDRLIAVVAGQPIYEQDLMSVAGPSLLDLHKQEYKLKSDALNQLIRKRLVEVEGKKNGLSTEELLKKEVDSKIADPSDEEAKGYYLAVKNETTLPFDQIKSQVRQLLKNAEVQQAREQYADSLRDKIEVSILLQPPVVQVAYDPARVKGNADALITIAEFADFQRPVCSKVTAFVEGSAH